MPYCIEGLSASRWSIDAVTRDDDAARYATREDAERALSELVERVGWQRDELRIVESRT